MATIKGTKANDVRSGTSGKDTINGLQGNDTLSGLEGADAINGNEGNDTLIGGRGADALTGGTGADTFKYCSADDSKAGAGFGIDTIRDFNSAVDVADLTELGEATLKSAYDSTFSGLQAVFAYNAGTNTTTLSYYNGSTEAVFQVKFTGNVAYSEAAFLGIIPTPPEPPATPAAATVTQVTDSTVTITLDVPEGTTSLQVFVTLTEGGVENPLFFEITDLDDPLTFTALDSGTTLSVTYKAVNDGGESALSTAVEVTPFVAPTPNDDDIDGTPYPDLVDLGGGDDQFTGGAGDDSIEGSTGNDTARFSGNYADYTLTPTSPSSWQVQDDRSGSPDGTDDVIHIEFLAFADGVLAFGTGVFTPNPPATPTGVTITQVTDHTVSLAWTASQGATSYDVAYTISGTTTHVTVSGTSTQISGLNANALYSITVAATNSGGSSAPSGSVQVPTLAEATVNDDNINGTQYPDFIDLGPGNDTFSGGSGNDMIDGGSQNPSGKDTVTGGLGADTFRFNSFSDFAFEDAFITPSDYLTALSGADRITDFTPGEDKIDLSDLDPLTVTDSDGAFSFVASFVANGQAQVMVVAPAGAPLPNSYLALLDRDGDGAGDYAIAVVTTSGTPTGLDFIL